MDMLLDIGALETVAGPDGRDDHAAPLVLTPLGRHLTAMPCDPAIGKLLIFGALLCCLDPVLTMAAALAHGRPMFVSAHAIREEVGGGVWRGCVGDGPRPGCMHTQLRPPDLRPPDGSPAAHPPHK